MGTVNAESSICAYSNMGGEGTQGTLEVLYDDLTPEDKAVALRFDVSAYEASSASAVTLDLAWLSDPGSFDDNSFKVWGVAEEGTLPGGGTPYTDLTSDSGSQPYSATKAHTSSPSVGQELSIDLTTMFQGMATDPTYVVLYVRPNALDSGFTFNNPHLNITAPVTGVTITPKDGEVPVHSVNPTVIDGISIVPKDAEIALEAVKASLSLLQVISPRSGEVGLTAVPPFIAAITPIAAKHGDIVLQAEKASIHGVGIVDPFPGGIAVEAEKATIVANVEITPEDGDVVLQATKPSLSVLTTITPKDGDVVLHAVEPVVVLTGQDVANAQILIEATRVTLTEVAAGSVFDDGLMPSGLFESDAL